MIAARFHDRVQEHDTLETGNHNVHILDRGTLFVGDIAPHGMSITYQVDPGAAGMYRFRCAVHPG